MTDLAVDAFLRDARALMKSGANESAIRDLFQQHLSLMFPDRPWWVQLHAKGVESHTRFMTGGKLGHGFVDALVGATIIEYEANLTRIGVADHARKQVRDYIAGEVNKGMNIAQAIGIVSDTLRWHAYTATLVVGAPAPGQLGEHHIILHDLAALDLTTSTPSEGADLKRFLTQHLGRLGARPLNATHLSDDLGLDSPFGSRRRHDLATVYEAAKRNRPEYAEMIARLWSELVDAIGRGETRQLGVDEYVDEFYLITLAKFICANVLDPTTKGRRDDELAAILTGGFFTGKGLPNYVEYDLFGWLSDAPEATGLLRVARDIQEDLLAYDFRDVRQQDLFGQLLSRLGRQHTRLILGQELTPPWLARRLVRELASSLDSEPMHLVDTACGSGAMLVEGLQAEAERLGPSVNPREIATRLVAAVTGFDVDPLAALFAKTNWVIAMRSHLPHLGDVTIPVFHADSLFAGLYQDDERFRLKLDDVFVEPPESLLDAAGRPVFDTVLSKAYELALQAANAPGEPNVSLAPALAEQAIREASDPTVHDHDAVAAFAASLIREIARLQRAGRNGLWSYVIRNTSRAAQATHQFNILAINPPWLALSKIKDNPYAALLARLAREFGIQPSAQSFLHVEMSSIFLLEGVRRYLVPGGVFGCILPSAVLNGNHQNRLRTGAFAKARRHVDMDVESIWAVDKDVFKNESAVVLGRKASFTARSSFSGLMLSASSAEPHVFHAITGGYAGQADRVVWSAEPSAATVGFGFYPAPFRQGADLMPRTAWFHAFEPLPNGRLEVSPASDNPTLRYLVADAKVSKNFRLPKVAVDKTFTTRAVLSNHLTPFNVAQPATMLIPARLENGTWRAIEAGEVMLAGAGTRRVFDEIAKELARPIGRLFDLVDLRHKLEQQRWPADRPVVISGAGGANPCAAWLPAATAVAGELIFDQTVYWAPVADEDEALFLVGAINSPTCAELIRPFQPKGQLGARHVHKLPFGVTPPYDLTDGEHRDLVDATKNLASALDKLAASEPKIAKARRPDGGSLASRRTAIANALRSLPEWAVYESASAAILNRAGFAGGHWM